jgi:hypothetical protein
MAYRAIAAPQEEPPNNEDRILVLSSDTNIGRSLRDAIAKAHNANLFIEVDGEVVGVLVSPPKYELLKAAATLARNPTRLESLLHYKERPRAYSFNEVFRRSNRY